MNSHKLFCWEGVGVRLTIKTFNMKTNTGITLSFLKQTFRCCFNLKKISLIFFVAFACTTEAQVQLVQTVRIGTPLYPVNGKILFAGDSTDTQTYQLWVSDGTTDGTHFLKSFSGVSGYTGNMPQSYILGWRRYDPIVFNNNLYFFALTYSLKSNGSVYGGYDLWKSDGTAAGTTDIMQFADQWPGTPFNNGLPSFCIMNNELYFACGNNNSIGVNLWKTDGITTTKVANIASNGFDGWGPAFLTTFNNAVYFVANDGVSGPEVWKSDGTTAGTQLLKDIFPGQNGVANRFSNYSGINPQFTVSGSYLYFTGWRNEDYDFFNVYRTDGTAAGTIKLDTTIYPYDAQTYLSPFQADANGIYFFTGYPNGINTGTSGLIKSNGTPAGTVEVITNNNIKTHGIFTSFINKLYFDGAQGMGASQQFGLCVSDGTTGGTSMVYPFPYISSEPQTQDFLNTGNTLYFRELVKVGINSANWRMVKTDGTTAGTQILYGVNAMGAPALSNGEVYFWGQDTLNTPSPAGAFSDPTFGLYKFPASGVLPVTLVNFTASLKSNQQVQLTWQIASEFNNKGFYIERSDDGVQFSSLQFINAKANSSQLNNYLFVDASPMDGINYYRLRQVDNDGKFSYSVIKKINIATNSSIIISPNPIKGNTVNIEHHLSLDKAIIRLTNIEGKTLSARLYHISGNNIHYALGNLAAGVYLLSIESNGKIMSTAKFVKE